MARDWLDKKKNGGAVKKAPKGFFEEKQRRSRKHKDRNKNKAVSAIEQTCGSLKLGRPAVGYDRSDSFYKSIQWRRLRVAALAHCRYCQACGRRPPVVVLHVDHVKPRYKHPELSLDPQNLQVLCEDCNIGKGAWLEADFR